MNRTLKKVISLLLAMTIVFGVAPLSGFVGLDLPEFNLFCTKAEAASYSGTCGDNLTWFLDTNTGVLNITGTGAMTNWTTYTSLPWYSYSDYIQSVKIGDSVTTVGNYAFANCQSLTSVTIGNKVSTIGEYAFNWCESLTNVTIGNSVTIIGDQAFNDCNSLTSVTIPDSVTIIGNNAFCNCTSLTSVTIPNSVTTILFYAFYGCASLENVYYTGGISEWCAIKFETGYSTNPMCLANNLYIDGKLLDGELVIPDSVTTIGDYVFYNCDSLTSVTIPDSVTTIGINAFQSCDSLTSVTIGNGVTSTGDGAFGSCTNLTSVTIPDSVTTIGDYAFSSCTNLTSVTIPNSVTTIGDYAFERCTGLTSIAIPDSVTTIGNYAFIICTGLTSIAIPDGVTIIGETAFGNCASLTNIIISDSVTTIGVDAFYNTGYYNNNKNWVDDVLYIGNHLIEAKDTISGSYTIKYGTLTIADYAFEKCTGLTSIAIPDSVTTIGDGTFCSCTNLTNVTIPNSVTTIGNYAFKYCYSLTSITIPDRVISIGEGTFYKCSNIISVTIGNSVTTIGDYAFDDCHSLTSVTIPDSVITIGDMAFASCDRLTDVYYSGTLEQWKKIFVGVWGSSLLNATIHYNSTGPDNTSGDAPSDEKKYKNATIVLDQNSYIVKEPNLLTIEGTITCPDGVDGLLMSWSFDEIDIFYTPSQTTYETVSETEMRFSQTFTPKKAGKFKVYARLPNDAEAECTVTSYQEAVSAFISEHYQFVKSDKYNDFVAEEYAQELAESMRNNSSYHWNNFVSINFFENYYDLVLAELLTNDTTKQSVKEEIEKIFSSEYVDLTNKLFDFINTTYQDSLGPISEADFYLVFNADTPKVYEDTAIYKALTKGLEDKTLFNNVFEINELFGYAQKIADAKECAVEGIVDCVYYFAAINAYRKADEEIKAVITKAAAKTNNSDLKESLESFASIDSENDYLGFAESLFDKFIDVGRKTAVKICFNSFEFERTLKYILNIKLKDGTKLADKVVKVVTKNGTTVGTIAQYANAVFAGVSLGMAVSELITNADDYSFYASKCTHAGDLAEVLLNVLNESAIDFKENKTLENAHFFDVAFNFYKDTQIYALNAMVESIYAQNSSAVAVIINKAKSASGYISTINRYKNLNCHKHDLTELINAEYYYVDEKYSGNKLIRVACPVDVYVYDSEGNLALSIENDFVEIFDDRLDAFVLNSEKYICVPLDEEFKIKIVSTDDGEMDYSVFEFDENSEMTREVSKENITLTNGKTFEGKVDNILNSDIDNYNLIVSDNQEVISMENDIACVPATNISISKSFVELKVGQSQGLVASISPINTTDKYVWISSDETVATVSENGTVNAIGEGNATIVAMVNDLIYAECEVNVVILKDYTISWVVDGVTTSQTVTEGDAIVKPTNPTKTDYAFIGWSPAVPDTMPAYDLTFTAVFEKSYICPDCGDEILGEDAITEHIAAEVRMKATVKIQNNTGSKTINYGETLRLTAITSNMPAYAKIYWYIDGEKKGEGENFNVSFESGTKKVEVKLVDSSGNVLKNASGNEIKDSESVTVKGSFFQKIISFFKNLFRMNRTVVQAIFKGTL